MPALPSETSISGQQPSPDIAGNHVGGHNNGRFDLFWELSLTLLGVGWNVAAKTVLSI
jgi:hypothetical protein